MSKKVNLIFAGLVFAALAVFLAAEGAEAFCVYNKTDIKFEAKQVVGGDFYWYIYPGDNACCDWDWQQKYCNKEGKKDSIVMFRVGFWTGAPSSLLWNHICTELPIKAGGWLTVTGNKKDGYKCEAHY